MKPNIKLFSIDIKSFINFVQLSSIINKGFILNTDNIKNNDY